MPRLHSTTLFATDGLELARVSCDGRDAPHPVEECVEGDRVVVILCGRFAFRDRRIRTVASPTTALFLPEGVGFEIRHPHGEGDASLTVRGNVAAQLVAAGAATRDISASGYIRIQSLVCLAAQTSAERLAIEEGLALALAPAEQRRVDHRRRDRAIADTIRYTVDLHYDSQVGLAELAAAADVSVFHACRAFRRANGTSIHRHVQETRLRHALALVLDTDRPLAQVALEAGFANQGHFGNRFRQRFGLAPGAARTAEGRLFLSECAKLSFRDDCSDG